MNLFSRFKTKPAQPAGMPKQQEVGWSESRLYGGKDFPKYNPDDLLTRKGYAIYNKMMTDEQVKAVVRFKRDAITSREWQFECAYESLSEDERKARIDIFTAVVQKMETPFLDSLNGIMSAMYNGFSLSEKVLAVIDVEGTAQVGVKKIKLKPASTFYFHTDEFGNVEKISQKFEGKTQDIEPSKFIHYVQNPDQDDHYGRSELRECYRAWFSKDMTLKFQNIHLERFAGGFIWAAPTNGKQLVSGTPETEALKKAISNIQAMTSILLPGDIQLNVEHPASTDMYERAIAQHDKSIAKALLVPNLMGISEQGSTGSYSQSQTQLEAFLWTLDADAGRLEGVLNAQLFKELGDLNWGDGMYPTFKFKPVSDARKMEVVKTWAQLVGAGAVQASQADEEFLRDTLELPKKSQVESDAPDLVLNGAQVTSLIDIVGRVGQGQITPEAAKAIITAVFPISDADAAAMVETAKPQPPAAASPDGQPVPPAPGGNPTDGQGGQLPEPQQPEPPQGGTAPGTPNMEETIVGKMGVSVSAFTKALKRVDFAVIANKADNASADAAHAVAVINSAVVSRLMALAEELKLGTADGNPADVQKLTYTAAEMSKLKGAAIDGLKDAWKIGESHAKRELAKAKGAAFATNDLALQDVAAEYMKAKGYTLSGDISAATKKQITNIMLDGIKTSKTAAETKQAVYKALESDGLLTVEAVAEAIGASTVKSASSRIETAIRTVSFEAINEARYQMFSDPAMGGFVEALEYSAILDDRTTEICTQLNGGTYAVDDEVWSTFRPPNHFNCRSLLIPVTQNDTWTPSDAPTAMPQKGFGFDRVDRPAQRHAKHDPTIDVLKALADNQQALTKALEAMANGERHFTINIDAKQGKTKKVVSYDESTNKYVMTEESDNEQG